MHTHERKLYVVIVHYGSVEPLRRAIEALRIGSRQPTEIVVVNNTLKPIGDTYIENEARIVTPSTNDGYGAGINFGFGTLFSRQPSDTDILVGMNNDVRVRSDAIAELHSWWQHYQGSALVGVVSHEGPRTVRGGRIDAMTGRAVLTEKRLRNGARAYVHGAFFSLNWGAFIAVRGMSERYFMYWEDVSLSLRARAAGVPLQLAPSVHVDHSEESPSQLADDKLYYLVRNGVLCLTSEGPYPYRWWWQALAGLRRRYHTSKDKSSVVARALRDARHGVVGKHDIA